MSSCGKYQVVPPVFGIEVHTSSISDTSVRTCLFGSFVSL